MKVMRALAVLYLASTAVLAVYKIGRPRRPLAHGEAIESVIICGLLAWLVLT